MQSSDVVFFEWASQLLAAATHLPKTCGIVTRLHRYEMYQWIDRIDWDVVDKVIFVSEAKRKEFLNHFPDQAPKTAVIYSAVDLDKFRPQPKTFRGDIGIICHLIPRKRVYDLILTFSELAQRRNDLHLHIAGGQDPSYLDYYHALRHVVRELALQDKVTFYGHVADTRNWYHRIDLLIASGYSEGLPAAPIEAMASGCYCLAHRWYGAEELLPEENLFYTDRQLQEKVLAYCSAPEGAKRRQREEMRAIACERFDISQTRSQIRQVIEEVGASRAWNAGA
jgi:glycosyltransferase involved in cell wall biosynthesis